MKTLLEQEIEIARIKDETLRKMMNGHQLTMDISRLLPLARMGARIELMFREKGLDFKTLLVTIKQLERELKAAKTVDDQIEDLQGEIDSLEAEVEDLESRLRGSEEVNDDLTDQVYKLEKQLDKQDGEISDLIDRQSC